MRADRIGARGLMANGVMLHRDDLWNTIPPDIQRRVEDGVRRIAVLRESISADAKVRQMPPVTVDPAAWTPGGDVVVHAASGIWPSGAGGVEFGVVVGAGPAIHTNDEVVRAVLVHEIAHIFQLATLSIEHIDSGAGGPLDLTTDNLLDEAREEWLLANGADWLAERDAKLMRWGDPRTRAMTDEVVALANAGRLPLVQPPGRMQGRPEVPFEWGAHIRSLRARRKG